MIYQKLNLYKRKKTNIYDFIKKFFWNFIGKPFVSSFIPGTYWRKIILRLFGAKIGIGGKIKSYIKVSEPWNLIVGDHCWLGENIWIDNLSIVKIGNRVCISQGVYICTGNHNYKKELFDLMLKSIIIEDDCWLSAKSIISPGSILKQGSIASIGSTVSGTLKENSIYKGNPAKFFKFRYD